MRNPNGYGGIHKLSGKRRKPWAVRITSEWDDGGKQKFRYLGYYENRLKAIAALNEFNKDPYTLEASIITFSELYDKFSAEKFDKVSQSSITAYKWAFGMCESLHDTKFVDLRKNHMQSIIDACHKSHATKKKIKSLFNQLFDLAMAEDVVTKDYSSYVTVGVSENVTSRKPFSQSEIELLWENVNRMDLIDTVLIYIYTGLRPSELLLIKTEDVNINERYMRGGIKNITSKNRVIPINDKILPLICKRYDINNEYLIVNSNGVNMSYFTYYDVHFKKIMQQLELDHKPHDCRHTFATIMDNAGANKLSIKRIMGHASKDVTDKVYTHKDIEELLKAIDLI